MAPYGRFQPSPRRSRNNKNKTQTRVVLTQQLARRHLLQQRLRDLDANGETGETGAGSVDVDMEAADYFQTGEADEAAGYETEHESQPSNPSNFQMPTPEEANRLRRRASRVLLYASWEKLLPSLARPMKEYRSLVHGVQSQPATEIHGKCEGLCRPQKTHVVGLFAHRMWYISSSIPFSYPISDFARITVTFCQCDALLQVLVRHGLFPTAPQKPITAVAISLLHLYRSLFEQSCDAVHAVALGLKNHYERNGFRLLNKDVICSLSLSLSFSFATSGGNLRRALQKGLRICRSVVGRLGDSHRQGG